jgi:succinate dehydrogenase/fumarate reductase flavoprotein subunit
VSSTPSGATKPSKTSGSPAQHGTGLGSPATSAPTASASSSRRQDQARDPHAVEELIDEIAELVRREGKTRVHEHLQQAMRRLSERYGNANALRALEAEIERLENSYV